MDIDDVAMRIVLDRQAVDWSAQVVSEVKDSDLDNPTPCGGWTLRQLVGHMIGHNQGFAVAASGKPGAGDVWDALDFEGEPRDAYQRSAAAVTTAFASGRLPEKMEVHGYGVLPSRTVLGMHIVDFVVHGWDVARSIGSTATPDAQLTQDAYAIMLAFPKGRPNKAFDVVFPVADDAPVLDRFIGYVGRDPQWMPRR